MYLTFMVFNQFMASSNHLWTTGGWRPPRGFPRLHQSLISPHFQPKFFISGGWKKKKRKRIKEMNPSCCIVTLWSSQNQLPCVLQGHHFISAQGFWSQISEVFHPKGCIKLILLSFACREDIIQCFGFLGSTGNSLRQLWQPRI